MKEFRTAKILMDAATSHASVEDIYHLLPEEVMPKPETEAFCLDILDIKNAFGLPLTLCFGSREEMGAAQLLLHKLTTQGYKVSFTRKAAYCAAI